MNKKTDKWKKYNRRRLIKALVAFMAVVLFAMPAVATFAMMNRSDSADAKLEEVLQTSERIELERELYEAEMKSQESETLIAGTSKLDIEPTTTEPMPEITTSRVGILSAAKATQSDASVTDAEEIKVIENEAVQDEEIADEEVAEGSDESATETDAEEVKVFVPNGKKVYLTFDDGPSSFTDDILDILDEYGVKATFFVVAEDTSKKEGLMEIVSRGHSIGLHSRSHDYAEIYSDIDSFIDDIDAVHDIVYRVTGVDSKLYRFPGGSATAEGWGGVDIEDCVDYLNDNGYTYYDWNALNGDAVNPDYSVETMVWNVMDGVRSNEGDSIVLMHDQDNHLNTVEALPTIIETLLDEGYEILPLDQNSPTFQQYINE